MWRIETKFCFRASRCSSSSYETLQFGERFIAAERPVVGDHVFGSIQSLARHIDEMDPNAWDVVIVDEFHHAEAATYTRLLEHLEPKS